MIKKVKLGSICDIYSAGDKPKNFSEVKTSELNVPVYGNGRDNEGLVGFTDKAGVLSEAVTVAARGSSCGIAFYRTEPYMPIVRLISLIAQQGIDTKYLYYQVCNRHFKGAGSGQPQITIPDIADAPIHLETELVLQEKYSEVLFSLDEKIANNNAICSNLEAMAKLLYDYWFVQFDFPDENGQPYKTSGGKMVWNDELKREIPTGWEVKPLSAFIADSKNGDWGNDTPKRKDDIEVTCFRGADFASITDDYHVTAPIRYISANNSDRLLLDGDLVTEISGGSPTQATGRVGYINQKFLDRNGGKMDCSNFCKAFTPVKIFYQYWLYQTWKTLYDAGVMFNYESKTTGIKNLMFDEFITWIRVPAPSDELLKRYQKVCSQYYDKIQEEFIESTQLASLRDFLLPMLMNGQVKVGDHVS